MVQMTISFDNFLKKNLKKLIIINYFLLIYLLIMKNEKKN